MEDYVSRYVNKLDPKGRVSVPARFRTTLAGEGGEEIFCHPALQDGALDCGGPRLMAQIRGLLGEMAPYSDEKDQMATALFGESDYLKIDGDGRTVLPRALIDKIGATDQVIFVGLGDKFQIWEPGNFEKFRSSAAKKAQKLRARLAVRSKGDGDER